MKRHEIIQFLIDHYQYSSYVEIGVERGSNFSMIKCETKIGVDPNPIKNGQNLTDFKMTSDEFFNINSNKYDIFFIDGLHHADQVYKDIKNSLSFLKENGTIVCHDMLPSNENEQIVPRKQSRWTGDCWKAWVKLRSEEKDLKMFVVNTDYGCGIIRKGNQELISIKEEINYENFLINKNKWMNIVCIEDWKNELCN